MSKAKFSVLVVEDEKLIARNISRSIQRVNSSFEVVAIASNGEEALAITDELLPNVVFTDICMPIMDCLLYTSCLLRVSQLALISPDQRIVPYC